MDDVVDILIILPNKVLSILKGYTESLEHPQIDLKELSY